jgi:hypothetical protein
MLTTTAEALAGQITVTKECSNCSHPYQFGGTDKAKLEALLGEEAYGQLFIKSMAHCEIV